MPPHLALGAGATCSAAALPSSGLRCLLGHAEPAANTAGGQVLHLDPFPQHACCQARGITTHILLQPSQGGPQGVPTPRLPLPRVVTRYQCQQPFRCHESGGR